MMKNTSFLTPLMLILGCLMLQSCKTTEKFCVTNPQITHVYSTNDSLMGTAQNGNINIQVTSDACYELMLAQVNNAPVKVPFGLDFKHKNMSGIKFAEYMGWGLVGGGIATEFAGCLGLIVTAAASDDDDDRDLWPMWVTIAGVGAAGLGSPFLFPAVSRLSQMSYRYEFSYNRNQSPKFDGLCFELLHPDKPKDYVEGSESVSKRSSKAVSRKSESGNSKSSNKKTQAKSRKGNIKSIAGTYSGNGSLKAGDENESLPSIEIIIKPLKNNKVEVIIKEQGENFFGEPQKYTASYDKKKGFELRLDGISRAYITIDNEGKLYYYHPLVEIDDTTYTLTLRATKSK